MSIFGRSKRKEEVLDQGDMFTFMAMMALAKKLKVSPEDFAQAVTEMTASKSEYLRDFTAAFAAATVGEMTKDFISKIKTKK